MCYKGKLVHAAKPKIHLQPGQIPRRRNPHACHARIKKTSPEIGADPPRGQSTPTAQVPPTRARAVLRVGVNQKTAIIPPWPPARAGSAQARPGPPVARARAGASAPAVMGPGDAPGSRCAGSLHRQDPPARARWRIWRTSGGHGSCQTHHIPTKFQRQNVRCRFLPYSGSLYVHTSY